MESKAKSKVVNHEAARSDPNLTNLSRFNAISGDHRQTSRHIRNATFGTSRKIKLKINLVRRC